MDIPVTCKQVILKSNLFKSLKSAGGIHIAFALCITFNTRVSFLERMLNY